MIRAMKAGVLYFAIVLAAGIALGTIRTFAVAPLIGETAAVAIELPMMLALSWLACRAIVNNLSVEARPAHRLVVGGTAFLLLMAAEAGLASLLLGRTPGEHLAGYQALPSLLGLLAQIAFALFPVLLLAVERIPGHRQRHRELT